METVQEEPAPSELRTRSLAIFYGVGGVLLALFAVFIFLKLWPVLVLILISLMLVAALTPIVRRIQNRFSRKTATTVVVVTLLLGIFAAIALTVPPVAAQLETLGKDFD